MRFLGEHRETPASDFGEIYGAGSRHGHDVPGLCGGGGGERLRRARSGPRDQRIRARKNRVQNLADRNSLLGEVNTALSASPDGVGMLRVGEGERLLKKLSDRQFRDGSVYP